MQAYNLMTCEKSSYLLCVIQSPYNCYVRIKISISDFNYFIRRNIHTPTCVNFLYEIHFMWLFKIFRYAELAHILKCLKRQIDHVSLQNEKSFLMCRRVIHAFYISHVFYEKYINLHQLNYIFISQPNERQQKSEFWSWGHSSYLQAYFTFVKFHFLSMHKICLFLYVNFDID